MYGQTRIYLEVRIPCVPWLMAVACHAASYLVTWLLLVDANFERMHRRIVFWDLRWGDHLHITKRKWVLWCGSEHSGLWLGHGRLLHRVVQAEPSHSRCDASQLMCKGLTTDFGSIFRIFTSCVIWQLHFPQEMASTDVTATQPEIVYGKYYHCMRFRKVHEDFSARIHLFWLVPCISKSL